VHIQEQLQPADQVAVEHHAMLVVLQVAQQELRGKDLQVDQARLQADHKLQLPVAVAVEPVRLAETVQTESVATVALEAAHTHHGAQQLQQGRM
jgi:hypothetical protein